MPEVFLFFKSIFVVVFLLFPLFCAKKPQCVLHSAKHKAQVENLECFENREDESLLDMRRCVHTRLVSELSSSLSSVVLVDGTRFCEEGLKKKKCKDFLATKFALFNEKSKEAMNLLLLFQHESSVRKILNSQNFQLNIGFL
jgi:hypothetical protein